MQAERYFGSYARFDTKSKKDAAPLLGADNAVGDAFDIVFLSEEGVSVAWLKNRFDRLVGFFNAEFSRKLHILSARGWTVKAFLSFVAYTDSPEQASIGAKSRSYATTLHSRSRFPSSRRL